MSSNEPIPAHRVSIVILTYKRNDALLRLVGQTQDILRKYRGNNQYELCVAGSDQNNPIAPLPAALGVQYSVNPGSGLNDNIYHFWSDNLDKYAFIFSISDDDLFAPWLNPLYLLDAAIETCNRMALFIIAISRQNWMAV